jgi:hypothetical protein
MVSIIPQLRLNHLLGRSPLDPLSDLPALRRAVVSFLRRAPPWGVFTSATDASPKLLSDVELTEVGGETKCGAVAAPITILTHRRQIAMTISQLPSPQKTPEDRLRARRPREMLKSPLPPRLRQHRAPLPEKMHCFGRRGRSARKFLCWVIWAYYIGDFVSLDNEKDMAK